MRFVVVEKKIGETPLQALEAWKRQHPAYEGVPASYAGRLDPMASGKLLILLGEECKRQKSYTGLDKEYEIEVLLDVGSDTGDVLGLCEYAEKESNVSDDILMRVLKSEEGSAVRAYPAFSSKTLRGKPLFLHALEGTLSDEEIPRHTERLYKVRHLGQSKLSSRELREKTEKLLALVPRTSEPSKRLGEDFRIEAVRKSWENVFARAGARAWHVVRARVTSASGAYMRSLAPRIGAGVGTRALALSIHRTRIGKYVPLGRFGFWYREY
jgi:tRNA pseudouridine(55) synthase